MNAVEVSFKQFFWRITACHMVTYMLLGILAYTIMDYPAQFAEPCSIMVSTDSPRVFLGPALQVIRGLIFAIVLFPFREVILESRHGWLKLWGLFLGLAIFSTAGPAAGSVEGMIYTKVPIIEQLTGLWEVVLQTLLCSLLFAAWYRKPTRVWNVCMGILVGLIVLMSVSGAVIEQPGASHIPVSVRMEKIDYNA
jgi:hypothetical protein